MTPFDQSSLRSHAYRFYPEVEADWSADKLLLTTPWFSAEIPLDALPSPWRGGVLEGLGDLAALLRDLPLVEALPADGLDEGGAQAGRSLPDADETPWPPPPPAPLLAPDEDPDALARSIAERSMGDAVVAFTLLRRYMFQSIVRDAARSEAVEPRMDVLVHGLQQAHHLTLRSVEELGRGLSATSNPASATYGRRLQAYIAEETGHHVFAREALLALGVRPDRQAVSEHIVYAMSLLGWCAETSPFALVACLGLYELGGYLQEDPVAEALIALGHREAARHVHKHFLLNKHLGHAAIGLKLAAALEPVSQAQIRVAIECLDLTAISLARGLNANR